MSPSAAPSPPRLLPSWEPSPLARPCQRAWPPNPGESPKRSGSWRPGRPAPRAGLGTRSGPRYASRWTPPRSGQAAPTAKGRSLLYLVNDLERLGRLTDRIQHTALGQAERVQLDEPARDLDYVAAVLEGQPGRGQQSPAPLQRVDLAARIRYAAQLAGTHAAAAAGARTHGRAGVPGLLSAASHAVRRIRANATPDSVQLRSAVQTGAALAVAYVAARTINVQHGFWVDLAALTVISSTARSTGRKMASAITGTLIGCVIAIGLIVAIGSDPADYAVITPLAVAISIWARDAIGFAAGQAGFTVAVLMLFSLLRPGWHIGLFRFEDVAIGVAVALAVSAVAWPGGARSALRADLAQLRTAAASYLKAVTENLAGLGHTDGELDQLRRHATAASVRAEAALSSLLSERPRPDETQLWSGAMSGANRIWYVADVLRSASGVTASPTAVSAAAHLEAAAGAAPPNVPACPQALASETGARSAGRVDRRPRTVDGPGRLTDVIAIRGGLAPRRRRS